MAPQRLLETIDSPADLKTLSVPQLEQLAGEIRHAILSVVSQTGGHLGASLGAVELTVAVHTVFDAPRDLIVWDVGPADGNRSCTTTNGDSGSGNCAHDGFG